MKPPKLPLSSSRTPRWKYDVFLNFVNETRYSFVDNLYATLNRNGINSFIRNIDGFMRSLEESLKAVEESRYYIVIFSQNYACSKWCLDELAHVVERKNQIGHEVFPVFYHIEPSSVRKQIESFHKPFDEYEISDRDKAHVWRTALREVGNLAGWHIKDNRPETQVIEEIIKTVLERLSPTFSTFVDDPVGLESRLEKLKECLHIDSNDVRVIGICGMGGIGKTTLAEAVYNLMSHHFDRRSFLANVREVSSNGNLVSLQKQLLSQVLMEPASNMWNVGDGAMLLSSRLRRTSVLLIIDDVDREDQLIHLAGQRDWFGDGSRIIITSRDENLLRDYGVDFVYKPDELDELEALRLLSLRAFKSDFPPKEKLELSKGVVRYANGLPLAIKVLGSFLYERSEEEWREAIERLKKVEPERDIHDVLKISFDGLEQGLRKMYLDIACFFKGIDADYVSKLCGFAPRNGMGVLIGRSLITVVNGKIRMHDLLQEMCWKIVKEESEPGRRTRLWEKQDIYSVLQQQTGTEAVEGIVLNFLNHEESERAGESFSLSLFAQQKMHLNAGALSSLRRLRLLRVCNVQLIQGYLEDLPNELQLLDWHGFPLKCFPSSFQMSNLVELSLCCSRIKHPWDAKMPLTKLKFLNLSYCHSLTKTPDFTGLVNLETLALEGCTRLPEVHPSLALLQKLTLLNMKNCRRIRSFPRITAMESLEKFILSGCSNLDRFPEIDGKMEHLTELHLDGTAIKDLPSSIGSLTSLRLLNLGNCKNLSNLPSSILDRLTSLKSLNLSGCSKLKDLPEDVGLVECLEELDISGTAVRQPPSSIFLLTNLKVLSLRGCGGEASSDLESHKVMFPFNLFKRNVLTPIAFKFPSFSGLCSLTTLDLSDCHLTEDSLPHDLGCLDSLLELNLSDNDFVVLPATVSRLPNLYFLKLMDCKKLQSLEELPSNASCVYYNGCFKLMENQGCNNLELGTLQKNLQVYSDARDRFDIIVPGSEIPDWFTHQSEGYSVKLQLPADLEANGKWLGIAVCSVFTITQQASSARNHSESDIFYLNCDLVLDGKKFPRSLGVPVEERMGKAVPDHIWIGYFARAHEDFEEVWEKDCSEMEFRFETFGPGLQVDRCGVRLVHENDFQVFNQAISQQRSSI